VGRERERDSRLESVRARRARTPDLERRSSGIVGGCVDGAIGPVQACHAALNGFGFGLENYNAAGEYQATDDGLPVDATGTISGTDANGPFNGGVALSAALAGSRVVHECATQELLRYALGRAPVDAERPTVIRLTSDFTASGGDIRALLTDIIASPTFRQRVVEDD